MTFNSEFPQTLLNEVLSITAQELFRLVIVSFLPGSSMKS